MTDWVVDYANEHPDLDALGRSGCLGIARYLGVAGANQPDSTSKNITNAEVDYCRTHNWSLVLVYEDDGGVNGGGPAQGFVRGARDGQVGNEQADSIGFPDNRPIYWAVDTDQLSSDTVISYFQGVASVSKRPMGGYGQPQLMDQLWAHGLIKWMWATAAWSGGYRSPNADLFQKAWYDYSGGGAYDENDIKMADFGQWNPGGTTPLTTIPNGGFGTMDDNTINGKFTETNQNVANVQFNVNRVLTALGLQVIAPGQHDVELDDADYKLDLQSLAEMRDGLKVVEGKLDTILAALTPVQSAGKSA